MAYNTIPKDKLKKMISDIQGKFKQSSIKELGAEDNEVTAFQANLDMLLRESEYNLKIYLIHNIRNAMDAYKNTNRYWLISVWGNSHSMGNFYGLINSIENAKDKFEVIKKFKEMFTGQFGEWTSSSLKYLAFVTFFSNMLKLDPDTITVNRESGQKLGSAFVSKALIKLDAIETGEIERSQISGEYSSDSDLSDASITSPPQSKSS